MFNAQWANRNALGRSYGGGRNDFFFEETVREIFGFPHVIATHQDRPVLATLRRDASRSDRNASDSPLPFPATISLLVITGYNTDVKHKSRVFHVQTEDKGASNPCVESLVYVGGEILATRRVSYAEMVQNGRDDQAIQELMEQQHRTMIAAIQRGKFDGPNGSVRAPEEPSAAAPEGVGESTATAGPGGAPGSTAGDRTLDQVILDYLASELTHEQLEVAVTGPGELVGGRPAQIRLKAQSSVSRLPVAGASVQVRILSTVAKPAVVFQGKTAADGSCAAAFSVPALRSGNAAAVIRVSSSMGSTEFKYPVKKP
jgi:hypothetical protein